MSDTSLKHNSDSSPTYSTRIDNEALRRRFNPDGSPLRNLQLRLLEMLKFFDGVCRKNNIPYWLSSGSCLGAVRHGGFIPWDDDVDVEIMAGDYPRLIEALNNEHSDKYTLQTHDNDHFWLQRYPKLRDLQSEVDEGPVGRNYRFKGIFIDIFLMEPSGSQKLAWIGRKLVNVFIMRASRLYTGRKSDWLLAWTCWNMMSFGQAFYIIANKFTSRKKLRHKFPNVYTFPRIHNDLFPLKECEFEGIKVFVPGNTHAYLSRLFGDYMKLPDTDDIEVHIKDYRMLK